VRAEASGHAEVHVDHHRLFSGAEDVEDVFAMRLHVRQLPPVHGCGALHEAPVRAASGEHLANQRRAVRSSDAVRSMALD
jgi:hypothetical protein